MKIYSVFNLKYSLLLMAAVVGLIATLNLASAQTWTPTSAPFLPVWKTIACSADGNKIVAAGYTSDGYDPTLYQPLSIYTSKDSGLTWVASGAWSNLWTSVASSADGARLVAVSRPGSGFWDVEQGWILWPGLIFISKDSGLTWTQTTAPNNGWSAVASSADGIRLVAVSTTAYYPGDGLIYTSDDSGVSWTQTSAPTNNWSGVASSSDGHKLVAVVHSVGDGGGLIYTSADSGVTWNQTSAPSNYWSSVASSADGIGLVAVSDLSNGGDGLIYISTNSGATWDQTTAPPDMHTSVASSADGTKLIAASVIPELGIGDLGGGIYSSSDSGLTWTQTGSPSSVISYIPIAITCSADGKQFWAAADRIYSSSPYLGPWKQASTPVDDSSAGNSWNSVVSSTDGSALAAILWDYYNGASSGLVYTSTNFGSTWAATSAPQLRWTSIASSADGSKLVAANYPVGGTTGGFIYVSADSGSTWKVTSAPYCSSLACSADGTKIVADSGYTSADSGNTWKQTSVVGNWVACSADGIKMVAADGFVFGSGPGINAGLTISVSINSGTTWTQAIAPATNVTVIAVSADRTRLVALALPYVYTSIDWGATWIQASAPLNIPDDRRYFKIDAIACSGDGTKLVAAGSEGIFISTNSGASWIPSSAPGELWQSIALSADGNQLVAVSSGDPVIYTLQLPLPPVPPPLFPRLAIEPAVASLNLSWLVPSTSFGLQENSDLTTTNWKDVLTTPTLNFTNLHYEVNVSPSPGSHFYRLKQQ